MIEVEDIVVGNIEKRQTATGKDMWSIEANIPHLNGQKRKYTVFEEEVAKKLQEYMGKVVCVNCAKSEKNDKIYWNIRGFNCVRTTDAEDVAEMVEEDEEKEKMGKGIEIPSKDRSIVAQCLTKCVCGDGGMSKEKVLETYKYFCENL